MLLPERTVSENIDSDSPSLAQLQRMIPNHGNVLVQSILIYALNELRDLVNIGKNLTNPQISFIANRIINRYSYFKIEEVKYVLHRSVEREKLYDRLDPNIVLGWFSQYDSERTEEAIRLSDEESKRQQNKHEPSPDGISWDVYVDRLWNLALYADPEAVEKLSEILRFSDSVMRVSANKHSHQSELDFKTFYYSYIRNGKK